MPGMMSCLYNRGVQMVCYKDSVKASLPISALSLIFIEERLCRNVNLDLLL